MQINVKNIFLIPFEGAVRGIYFFYNAIKHTDKLSFVLFI